MGTQIRPGQPNQKNEQLCFSVLGLACRWYGVLVYSGFLYFIDISIPAARAMVLPWSGLRSGWQVVYLLIFILIHIMGFLEMGISGRGG